MADNKTSHPTEIHATIAILPFGGPRTVLTIHGNTDDVVSRSYSTGTYGDAEACRCLKWLAASILQHAECLSPQEKPE